MVCVLPGANLKADPNGPHGICRIGSQSDGDRVDMSGILRRMDHWERCSGLPVVRHDAASLGDVGSLYRLVETKSHDHRTPDGSNQRFQFSLFVGGNSGEIADVTEIHLGAGSEACGRQRRAANAD
jgi:hypothetical protein